MTILIDLQKVTLQGADRPVLENLLLTASSGDDIRRGRGIQVGYLEQIPVLPAGTVRSALGTGWQVDAALDRLGMLGAADTDTANLSGGQLKRVALARIFAEPNDVLILDEPTNHLDLAAIQWLEQQIVSFRGAVILVSHDRFLLDQVTTRMVEIDRGKTYVHGGGYSRLLEAQAEREEQAASAEQVRRNLARTELAWLRRGVKARSTKPQARIDAAERLLASRPEAAARAGTLELSVEMPRLGTMVIKAHNVAFSYANGRQVLSNVNLELGPGDRIGIVGPNGAGKSTFLNLLARRAEPTSGTVKVVLRAERWRFRPGGDRPGTGRGTPRHPGLAERRGVDEALLVQRSAPHHEGEGPLGWRASSAAASPRPVGATQRLVPRRTDE